MAHTSIASLTPPFDFFDIQDDEQEQQQQRQMWKAYVREFAVFYFDTFVEYIQALILQGSYTVEDAEVFLDVIGKLLLLLLK